MGLFPVLVGVACCSYEQSNTTDAVTQRYPPDGKFLMRAEQAAHGAFVKSIVFNKSIENITGLQLLPQTPIESRVGQIELEILPCFSFRFRWQRAVLSNW